MKVRKDYRFIFVGILLIAIFNGCGKKEIGTANHTKIVFYHCESSAGQDLLDELIKEFEITNPNIKVKQTFVPQDAFFEKMLTMIAAGASLDVFEMDNTRSIEFISRNVLLPLDEYIKHSDEVQIDDFFDRVLDSYRFDGIVIGKGTIYGLPKDWSVDYPLYYNKDLFDQAGIPYPNYSWSWDELLSSAIRLTKRDDSGRLLQIGLIGYGALPFIYQNGGRFYSDNGKKCLIDSPDVIEAYKFYIDMELKHKVIPSYGERTGIDYWRLIGSNRAAMWGGGRYITPLIEKRAPNIRWGVGPAPRNKKRANIMLGPWGWVINRNTKHPEEAWKFLEFLAGKKGQTISGQKGWNVPTLRSIAISDAFLSNTMHDREVNALFLEEAKYVIPRPISPYITVHKSEKVILEEELGKVYFGESSVEQALKRAAKRINEEIDKGE